MKLRLLVTLGAAHAASDGTAGWLLAYFATRLPIAEVGLLVLLYNALAFAAQPAIGLLLDRVGYPRRAVFASLGLMSLSLLIVNQPIFAVLLAGLASAVFHVGGGMLAIDVAHERASGLGVFTAPGVIGLACGGALAAAQLNQSLCLIGLIIVMVSFGLFARSISSERSTSKATALTERDSLILMVFIAIALRSAVWSAFQGVLNGNTSLLLTAALAAGTGKLIGGVLADRVGWRTWTLGSAASAALLLAFGSSGGWPFFVGLALLQSVTPVAWATLAQVLPDRSGLAAGLSLGLAIAVGGLLVFDGFGAYFASPWMSAILIVSSGVALLWTLNRTARAGVKRADSTAHV